MKNKNLKAVAMAILVSGLTAVICLFVFRHYFFPKQDVYVSDSPMQVHYARYEKDLTAGPNDFTKAAGEVLPATVHINTKVPPQQVSTGRSNGPFGSFWDNIPFGGGGQFYSPGKLASGSGAIISQDGYIVTCNHVIDGASEIVVTLNDQRTYKAKVIGTDPNTDLAVLKIDAKGLPYLTFGNSDAMQIGQWVLACGYPLNLQSTVTAGIISAKSRHLGILSQEGTNPIESYLQTDAAVNPGNSGGPLVNTEGHLVGINAAIATPTRSFAGYAYAVPSNLVRKVVDDIMKYGKVQRAFLGIYMKQQKGNNPMMTAFQHTGQDIKPGVVVADVTENGAAADGGLQKGDRIVGIDGAQINHQNDLLGILARHHPGDKVQVTYMRDGSKHETSVVLKNRNGTTAIVKNTIIDALGAQFITLTPEQAKQLGISGGVYVKNIGSGLIKHQTDMEDGFVIVQVGNYSVKNVDDLKKAFEKQGNNVMIRGFYPGYTGMMYYAIHDVKSAIVN